MPAPQDIRLRNYQFQQQKIGSQSFIVVSSISRSYISE